MSEDKESDLPPPSDEEDLKMLLMDELATDDEDEPSDFECCECGEELGVTGACTNEDCCEFDPEEEK